MRKIKFGIIGAGKRGMYLCGYMLQTEMYELVAMADPDMDNLEKENKYCCKKFINYEDILKEDIELVVIASPNDTHEEIAIRCLKANKHIMLEKPMALSFKSAINIYKAWENTNVIVQLGFVLRYNPIFQKCKEILSVGTIGRVYSAWELHGIDYGSVSYHCWRGIRNIGGTLFFEKMTHDIDIINWMLESFPQKAAAIHSMDYYGGEMDNNLTCSYCEKKNSCVDSYHTKLQFSEKRRQCVFRKELDLPSNMCVIYDFFNGVKVSYNANFFATVGTRNFRFIGTKGELSLNLQEQKIYLNMRGKAEKCMFDINFSDTSMVNSLGGHGGEENQFIDLYNCIINNKQPLANLYSGLRSILAAEMAEKSADNEEFIKSLQVCNDAELELLRNSIY